MDHSSMDHSSMDNGDGDGGMMGMADMMMTFFTSTKTPLLSEAWTPHSTGQYAATCVFLIALAAVFRGIIAIRAHFPLLIARWLPRRSPSKLRRDIEAEAAGKMDRPVTVTAAAAAASAARPWNLKEALARALLDTILAGVSYLLMLAVMTMNVGYFLATLAGTFLGSFVVGDWAPTPTTHCDAH